MPAYELIDPAIYIILLYTSSQKKKELKAAHLIGRGKNRRREMTKEKRRINRLVCTEKIGVRAGYT